MAKLSKREQMILLIVVSSTVLGFGVVILVGGAHPLGALTNKPPTTVYVTGDVVLKGSSNLADTPTGLNFTAASGQVYLAIVSGGSYTIILPNDEDYAVTIGWSGVYPWQKGVVSVGTLSLNQTAGTYQAQFSTGDAPPSYGQMQGLVNTTGVTPTAVSFSGAGGNFTTPISGGSYSVQLPNGTSYQVQISWQGGGCSAGTVDFVYSPGTNYDVACST